MGTRNMKLKKEKNSGKAVGEITRKPQGTVMIILMGIEAWFWDIIFSLH